MPKIGDIRRHCGKTQKVTSIWATCVDCGKERWVHALKGQAKHPRCCSCANRLKAQYLTPEGRVKIGDRQRGAKNKKWNGGRTITHGYIRLRLYQDDFFYSMTNKKGYVLEHRLVVAKALGRCLHRWEIVHHKGVMYPKGSIENKQDNRYPENLQLVTDDRHKQITTLEMQITQLKKENQALRQRLQNYGISLNGT